MIDDNRNNWRQLGVRKRTCFVGTAIISNWTAIIKKNIFRQLRKFFTLQNLYPKKVYPKQNLYSTINY